MWGKIKALIGGILFAIGGAALLTVGGSGIGKERIAQLQAMAADPGKSVALLDNQYTEHTRVRRRRPDTTYWSITFRYEVDGKTYRGEKDVYTEPDETSMIRPICYLKSDPAVHSFDPQGDLDSAETTQAIMPWAGAGLLVVALGCFVYLFKGGGTSGRNQGGNGSRGRRRRG